MAAGKFEMMPEHAISYSYNDIFILFISYFKSMLVRGAIKYFSIDWLIV